VDTGLVFGILGPLEVRRGGTLLRVGGPRQRALLAVLLCHANRVVSRDQLLEELLGDQPPGSAERMLRVQVSRLRTALAGGGGPPRVLARPPGYLLRVEPGELDLEVFEQRVAAGRDALGRGDPGRAAALLGAAESLWRGRPLADLEFEPFARFEIQRLAELRLLAAEDRVEAELALGQHGALCPELGRLVAEHPLRERLRGQLMLALYRSGRQAEALDTYRAGRLLLVEELGVEPGPVLRQVHEQVLAADPLLDLPARPGAAATRALPRDIAAFTGRERELARLLDRIGDLTAGGAVAGIHAIDGMAGIGKTTLAVHAAHRLARSFPDGQFFLPLHAHTPGQRPVDPADALASLLLTAGLAPQQIPPGLEARAARWRDHLAGKKILLLLDDAAGQEQVAPLLPGTAGSLVLVTSRRRLAALQDTAVISLDTLSPGEAAELLARLAGRLDLASGDVAVAEITRLCGYLPLAIGMLASQLRHHPAWTAVSLAADLAGARDRLTVMRAENLSVAAAFDLSYHDLTPAQQRLFRRLGLVPGPDFDAHAAAALDDTSLDAARRGLDELYDQHLIGEPAPGRYRLHDLLREHARTLAADDHAARDAATDRLLGYYLHTALAASKHIARTSWNPAVDALPPARLPECAPPVSAPGQAAAWLETERAGLHAAAGYAAASDRPRYATLIPAAMAKFLEARGHWDQALTLHQIAVAAARRAGDQPSQARALMQLGAMQALTGDLALALATFQQALAVYRDLGDRAGEADATVDLGFVHGQTGNYPAATACHQQALELFRDLGDLRGQADALNNLGIVHGPTGDYASAAACCQQALELFRGLGDQYGQADALINLSAVQHLTGDYPAAADTLQQVMALNRDLDNRSTQAWVLNERGVLKRLTGDYAAAAASHQQALELFRDLGERSAQAGALNELGLVQQLTGDHQGAAASHYQALRLYRDLGDRHGQADVLNSLGELASRTADTSQARDQHNQACAIARDIGVPFEEARALEGIGHSHLHDANPSNACTCLQQALAIYQRIESPSAQRVQETLNRHGLPLHPDAIRKLPKSAAAAMMVTAHWRLSMRSPGTGEAR
jgi:DNA-binding SARP family transcriptional activator/tetratricopeptide (TPR) repeat protein